MRTVRSWTVRMRLFGDGDFEDIGGEVFEACLRGRDGLRVDVPVDEPDFRGDLIEEAGFNHLIAELSSKDFGESFDGEIEVGSGRMPAAVGSGSASRRQR